MTWIKAVTTERGRGRAAILTVETDTGTRKYWVASIEDAVGAFCVELGLRLEDPVMGENHKTRWRR